MLCLNVLLTHISPSMYHYFYFSGSNCFMKTVIGFGRALLKRFLKSGS